MAGLREGDNHPRSESRQRLERGDFDKAMRNVSNGATLLLVKRGDNTFYVAVQK